MAAIAYPTVRPSAYSDTGIRPERTERRLQALPVSERRALTRRRRLVVDVVGICLLVATYFGASALVGLRHDGAGTLPGAVRVAGGYSYVVRPGDSLWSIASSLEPNGDPRALVDRLTGELGGSRIETGERIFVALPN